MLLREGGPAQALGGTRGHGAGDVGEGEEISLQLCSISKKMPVAQTRGSLLKGAAKG